MEIQAAVGSLSALAQESRLGAFRLLVQAGPSGLPAGAIAKALDIPHNTLSTHLGILVQAGLVTSERQSRSIIYRTDLDGTRQLLTYLLEDCCQGAPALCHPAVDSVSSACCSPQ